MQKTHIAYSRVSTNNQEVESQKKALQERLNALQEPVKWIEDVWTGTNADRAGYQEMTNIVNAGWAIDIYTWRADRIGRNALENLKFAQACKDRSTDIIGVGDGIRLLSPNGNLVFNILSAIAEYEAEKISTNTRAGLAVARGRGKCIGGSPEGYVKQHILDQLPLFNLLLEKGWSDLKISEQIKWNRKTVTRIRKMIEQGIPLRTRKEVLDEVKPEKRGKSWRKQNGYDD